MSEKTFARFTLKLLLPVILFLHNTYLSGHWILARLRWRAMRKSPVELPDFSLLNIHLLVPGKHAHIAGMDLQERVKEWMQFRGAHVKEIEEITDIQDHSGREPIVIILYESFLEDSSANFARLPSKVRSWRRALRQAGGRALVFLPDTYDVRFSLAAARLVGPTNGWVVVCQDSARQANRFGLPNVAGPHIWTYTPRRLRGYDNSTSLTERPVCVLIPGTGDARRLATMELLARHLRELGIDYHQPDGSLPFAEYLSLLSRSKIVVTTCWTQDYYRSFWSQPFVSKWISPKTTTGKVWEAFAVEAVLMTHRTETLDILGFEPGKHYLELDGFLATPNLFAALDDDFLQGIATRGHLHFRTLVSQREV